MTLYTLQLLRFIAALLVLFFHLHLVASGYKGVDIFFVISGFVMYATLFTRGRPKHYRFAINRLTKIFFLYWVALIFLYIVMPFAINLSALKAFLLFPGHHPVLSVSWTLSYELYFYFLTGVMVYVMPRRLQQPVYFFGLIIAMLVTGADLTALTLKGTAIHFLCGPNLWEFLLGILSAFLSASYYLFIKPSIALPAAVACGLLFCMVDIPYANPFSYVVYGLLAFCIVGLITAYEKSVVLHKNITVVYKTLGDASYAIYLFGPVVTIAIPASTHLSQVIIITTTITFSILFNQLAEQNFLRWSRKVILPMP